MWLARLRGRQGEVGTRALRPGLGKGLRRGWEAEPRAGQVETGVRQQGGRRGDVWLT
jgi:hypothetical protein